MDIHGLACFQTSDGLQAFGSGRLKSATQNTSLFEFRDPMRGGSEYLSSTVPTVFVRKFYYRDIPAHLVGVVKKTNDKFGRTGFWGVSAMVDDDKPIDVKTVDYLLGVLEFSDKGTIGERQACFRKVLGEHDKFPPGPLAAYEAHKSLVFSIGNGALSNQILQMSKSLMKIEPSMYSTIIVHLGAMRSPNLGELTKAKYDEYVSILQDDAEEIEAELDDLEGPTPAVAPTVPRHVQRFIDRGVHLGVKRPEGVDADFEDYLIALIKYVNASLAKRKKR